MTSLAEQPTADDVHPAESRSGSGAWVYAGHGAIALLVGFWALPYTHAVGGRGVHAELLFSGVLIPVVLALRVWRLSAATLVLAGTVAASAITVCVVSPTGWWGADTASGYVVAAAAYLAARRYVVSDERRLFLAAAICLAGVTQFVESFVTWYDGRDPAAVMAGTFYWHNPYAAFLLPGAVIGLALVARGRSPYRTVGWISTPTCAAGIVLSSSRATLAVLVVAWVLVLVGSWRSRPMAGRTFGAVVLAVAFTFLLPGPPLFAHYSSPFAAAQTRGNDGQSLAQNGTYRTEFWREAAEVAIHHPVAGAGFHSLATDTDFYEPVGWAHSQLAHDGYLQALTDGGLLLGVPFLLAMALLAWTALRWLFSATLGRTRRDPDIVMLGVAVAVLGGMAHSAVDFDWSHPSLLVELALLGACLAPAAESRSRTAFGRRIRPAVVVVVVAMLGISTLSLHQWQRDQPSVRESSSTLLAESNSSFGDFRPAAALLAGVASGARTADASQVRDALRLTASEAKVDISTALIRDAAAARLGLDPDAANQAKRTLVDIHGGPSPYVSELATVLMNAGESDAARDVLAADIAKQVRVRAAAPGLSAELMLWSARLGRGSAYACEINAIRGLRFAPLPSTLPRPTASCVPSSVKD